MTSESTPDRPDFLDSFLEAAFSGNEPVSVAGSVDLTDAGAQDDADSATEADPELIARYPVAERLGAGGVGIIYRAHDRELGRDIAIKVLRRKYSSDPSAVDRFLNEARVASRLEHPGIVPIHESGRLEDGRPFFTMKIVEGKTLEAFLTSREERGLIEIFEKVAQTLAFAHSHGVVHGDLKPQNIMVGAFGEVQVMDWGFAREIDTDQSGEHRSHIFGTPAYMAPEQAVGDARNITPRTDCFGLGAILCEILTGAPPYRGESRAEILLRASKGWLDEAIERITKSESDLTLVGLALDCLERDPGKRPADAAVVAKTVGDHLRSLAARARASELEAEAARAAANYHERVRKQTLVVSLVGLVVIVTALGIWFRSNSAFEGRRILAEASVAADLERAKGIVDQARSDGPPDRDAIDHAIAAAREAVSHASASEVRAFVRSNANDRLAQLESERAIVIANEKTVEQLESIHPHGQIEQSVDRERTYSKIFRDIGIEVDGDPDAAATALRASAIKDVLVDALDEWSWLRAHNHEPSREWKNPLAVARTVDADPFRRSVRDAVANGDLETVQQLAAKLERDLPVRSLSLLARSLRALGARDAAIEVYRSASGSHPEDYWIHHDLASLLVSIGETNKPGNNQPDRIEEVIRHYSMALVLRPKNAHALTDLGMALMSAKRFREANEYLEKAVAITPGEGRIRMLLGFAADRSKDDEAAARWYQSAIDLGFDRAFLPYVNFALARGEFVKMRSILDRLRTTAIGYHPMLVDAAQLFLNQGDSASAERLLRQALAEDPADVQASQLLVRIVLIEARFADAETELDRAERLAAAGKRDWSATDRSIRASVKALRDAFERMQSTKIADHDLDVGDCLLFGRLAYATHDDRRAATLFQRAIELEPSLEDNPTTETYYIAILAFALASSREPSAELRAETVQFARLGREWLARYLRMLADASDRKRLKPAEGLLRLAAIDADPSLTALRDSVGDAAESPAVIFEDLRRKLVQRQAAETN